MYTNHCFETKRNELLHNGACKIKTTVQYKSTILKTSFDSGCKSPSCNVSYTNNRHLITGVFVIRRLSLHKFALWGRDLMSDGRVREGPYYRGFLKENFRILSGHRKLSVIETCPLGEVPRLCKCSINLSGHVAQ